MPHPGVKKILDSLNRDVLNQLALTVDIPHPGESGRARENVLADYLRRLLPKEFAVDTGFVFDAGGKMSKQIDIVIYRADYFPVFEIGGIKHYIVESVAAAIENKASIASQEKLSSALENIKSVKQLDRTGSGKNYVLIGRNQGGPVNPWDFCHQIFGAIATENSLASDGLRDGLLKFLRENDRRWWPNTYVDVRGLATCFLKRDPTATTRVADTMDAEYLAFTNPAAPDAPPPLLELTERLLDFLRVAQIVDYSPSAYLGGGDIRTRGDWKI
jgi:hypothetical protein